jgi:putative hemolysin
MRLADRTAAGLMTPRGEVEVLNLNDDVRKLRRQLRETRRSRLPVRSGGADEIIGVVMVRDVIGFKTLTGLAEAIQKAPIVSDNASALDVIGALRNSTVHIALVFDEYGHFEGVVSAGDVLEAITGVFQEHKTAEPAVFERDDGSFLVSGWMPVDEFADRFDFVTDKEADYQTVAGLVINTFNHIPEIGERFQKSGWEFEVVDRDGLRIDKVLIKRKMK